MMSSYTPEIEERFWRKVNKDGPVPRPGMSNCWLWTASLTRGYGEIFLHGKNRRAHRVGYVIQSGTLIPDGLSVLHKCDINNCVRLDHLFLGTQTDNMRDMHAKGRGILPPKTYPYRFRPRATTCSKGHLLEGENLYLRKKKHRYERICRTCQRQYRHAHWDRINYMKREA
jgi:hypothetical protein